MATDPSTALPVSPAPCPLMDLAAELRNRIWMEVNTSNGNERQNLASCRPPAITRVSHQIRSETMGMFFAFGKFFINVRSNLTDAKDVAPNAPQRSKTTGRLELRSGMRTLIKSTPGAVFHDVCVFVHESDHGSGRHRHHLRNMRGTGDYPNRVTSLDLIVHSSIFQRPGPRATTQIARIRYVNSVGYTILGHPTYTKETVDDATAAYEDWRKTRQLVTSSTTTTQAFTLEDIEQAARFYCFPPFQRDLSTVRRGPARAVKR